MAKPLNAMRRLTELVTGREMIAERVHFFF